MHRSEVRIIGIIPARYASSRFPGKPLTDIKGKSMIRRVYERASSALEEVWVATDDDRIFDHVRSFGGNVAMTSTAHESGTERCAEVVEDRLHLDDEDVVINIQGDEPLIDPAQIGRLSDLFLNEEVKIGTLIQPISDGESLNNPNVVKAVIDNKGKALYFSRSPLPFYRDSNILSEENPSYQHIGIYGYRVGTLKEIVMLKSTSLEQAEKLEQLRWMQHGLSVHTAISHEPSIAIDTPEDLAELLKRFGNFLT
jgi:3-deoxy-manno-octulosonate cytidylyltransferase (CMP-KDO synthetase)